MNFFEKLGLTIMIFGLWFAAQPNSLSPRICLWVAIMGAYCFLFYPNEEEYNERNNTNHENHL